MKVQLSKTIYGGLKVDLDVHNDNGGVMSLSLGDVVLGEVKIEGNRPAIGNLKIGDDKKFVEIHSMYFLPATLMLDGSLRLICDYSNLDGETSSYGGNIFTWEYEVPKKDEDEKEQTGTE